MIRFGFHKFFLSLSTSSQNNKLEGQKGNKRERENVGRRKEVENTRGANPIKSIRN